MDKAKIHMVIGDDIYYEHHDFQLLPYVREKPMKKDVYRICYE